MKTITSDALARICEATRQTTRARKAEQSAETLRARIADQPHAPRPFADALPGLIAELKRASPSAGTIRADFEPAGIARCYETAGAACLSVLTEPLEFRGSLADLQAARAATRLPTLRKDFILDPWQVLESRLAGADCILLIIAALEAAEAVDLAGYARSLDMDVLVEIHDEDELARALACDTRLIGINNRDLRTLRTDLATTARLAPLVPADRIVVAESGIRTSDDLRRLRQSGASGFLVGESLLRQPDLVAATRTLLSSPDPAMSDDLTHLDARGRAAMVDVATKPETDRQAIAACHVAMRPATLAAVTAGGIPKGDVLAAARIAGIMAAKRTAELIPLCHPLALTRVAVDVEPGPDGLHVRATVATTGRTGVEMEALTAASVAALTIYDMCKAIDRAMRIEALRVVEKSGGRSGAWTQP